MHEILRTPEDITVLLPPSVSLFLSQTPEAAQRRELYRSISNPSEDRAKLYRDLTDFIEADENNARILLYLPFELLPNLSQGATGDEERFAKAIKNGWIRLLFESEPRANFVDGDVLEPLMGEPTRVRKAGHLVPELLSRGIIDTSVLVNLLEMNSDNELLSSLREGIVVAKDKGLVDDFLWEALQKRACQSVVVQENLKVPDLFLDIPSDKLLGIVADKLEHEISRIESYYADDAPYARAVSHKRIVWEKQLQRDTLFETMATALAKRLANGEITRQDIEHFYISENSDYGFIVTRLQSIFFAGEMLAATHDSKVRGFAQESIKLLGQLVNHSSHEVKNAVLRGFSRWRKLELVDDETLATFGMRDINVSALMPFDVSELLSKDLAGIEIALKDIEQDSYLSQYVYPFVVAFGSRVKGYALSNADTDIGIFFRPETPWEKREEIFARLKVKMPYLRTFDETPAFWLKKDNGKFKFRQGAPLIHFLFGSIWVGRGSEMKQIQSDLVARYMNLESAGEQKDDMRRFLLRQLEMDALQFRLLHKGYWWFYPDARPQGTAHGALIGWDSAFWDPGYRKVATLLFLSRVFLPDFTK